MKLRWIAWRAAALAGAGLAAAVPAHADDATAIARDAKAIAGVVESAARAMSELPETNDRDAVLRLYSPEYTGVTDGEWQTREAIETIVNEIDENVKAGNPVTITNRATEIVASPGERFGWATWISYSRIEVLGEVLGEVERRCTGIFRRTGKTWLIRHEHCSAPWTAPDAAGTGGEEPPAVPGPEESAAEEAIEG